jgi:hypothetical protein
MGKKTYVIYKLFCNDPRVTECYIGSTTHIWKRLQCHKHSCESENRNKVIQPIHGFINSHGGWHNWNIEILEILPHKWTTDEVRVREQSFIDKESISLNVVAASKYYMNNTYSNDVIKSKSYLPCVLATMNTGDRWVYLRNMHKERTNNTKKDNIIYM